MKTRCFPVLNIGLGLVVFGSVVPFLAKTGLEVRELFRVKPEARREMKHLWSRVYLGQSQTQFNQIFLAGRYKSLKLRRLQPNNWLVTTPLEMGAKNWHFHIEFDAKNQVGAFGIRTNDSIYQKPQDNAPADIVSPLWRRPFPRNP